MGDIIDRVLDPTIPAITKQIDLTARRNEAITSNIANAETPAYRATDLNFENELQKAWGQGETALMRTDSRHMDISGNESAHLVADRSGATKSDGNNVDIDIQMGKLAYNGGQFSLATTVLKKKLGLIRNVIREGQR